MKLKFDCWIKRKYSPKIKNPPKIPLTQEQKDQLKISCQEKCYRAYKSRFKSSKLMADFEDDRDFVGESFIAMDEILNRFDLSKCGQVAEYDVEGEDKPKTLEFYFYNYFCGRVNFMACEARSHKKARNVQFSTNPEYDEIEYNPIDDFSNNPSNQNYEITGHIMNELEQKNKSLRRFFYQTYILECSYKELVDEYGQDHCKELREELQSFIESIKKKYRTDFGSQDKKRTRGRKKKTAIATEAE